MFHYLGVDWAGSLLGFLALAFLPIPFLFYIFGPKLRKMSHYAPDLPRMNNNSSSGDEESGSPNEDKAE